MKNQLEEEIMEFVGSRIYWLRKRAKMSRLNFVLYMEQKTGFKISEYGLHLIENGLTNPGLKSLSNIAKALDVHITDLLPQKEELKEPNIINDQLEKNGNPEISKQVQKEIEENLQQETLEEAAERILGKNEVADGDMILSCTFPNTIKSMVEMAKWQAEKMYSEEEVEKIAKDAYVMGRKGLLIGVFNKWFEQFKKK